MTHSYELAGIPSIHQVTQADQPRIWAILQPPAKLASNPPQKEQGPVVPLV